MRCWDTLANLGLSSIRLGQHCSAQPSVQLAHLHLTILITLTLHIAKSLI